MSVTNLTRFFAAMSIVLVVVTVQPMTVWAQARDIEITPTASYMWGGSYSTYNGYIRLEDGVQYGGIIDIPVAPQVRTEFFYATLSSRATFAPYHVGQPQSLEGLDVKVNVHYFQLGAIHQVDKGRAHPFVGFAVGAVLFHPGGTSYKTYTLTDTWRFAMSMSGGLKISLSDVVALRLQGRLLLPVYFSGGGLWVGTGGASVGITGGVPIVQGDVGAGLSITL